nr:membrane-bound PQQ-dependent dehydrogenase, glucose/quinate/shikimate family [Rhizobium halophytocola]
MRSWLILLGIVLLAAGLFFLIGGGKLVSLGGSWYFLIAGAFLIASAVQLIRARLSGGLLFGLIFIATILWSLWEVGLDFWPLVSRLLALAVGAAVVMATTALLFRGRGNRAGYAMSLAAAVVCAIGAAGGFYGMFQPHPTVAFAGTPAPLTPVDPAKAQKNWAAWGNTDGGNRFAALDQITRDTVKDLKVAWTFRTGDTPISPNGGGAEDQETPLQIGKSVYLCTPHNTVIAVDSATGKQEWRHEFPTDNKTWVRCRGLAYFDATAAVAQPTGPGSTPVPAATVAEGANCQRRILMNTIDAVLVALDADTGEFCQGFGDGGKVDLKKGLGAAPSPLYELTSPPAMAGTTVVVGGRVADNVKLDMPGGVVRGFDVITGQQRWAFDPGNPTDQAATSFVRSTPNVWAPMSYDPMLNTVFMSVGGAAIDLWGVKRTELDEKYGASVLALDATTGKEKWHYQTVHHDLWDYDVPMQPTLFDFTKADGTKVPALTVGTKVGQIFVLDRETGKPLTKVVEQPVKKASIPDEQYSTTQPVSVGMPQIGAETLTEADMWGATPFDQLACRIIFKEMRYTGLFTTPDVDYSLSFPGSLGGLNWGSMSYDDTDQTLYVNDMRLGLWVHMEKEDRAGGQGSASESVNAGMGAVPLGGTPYSVKKDRFLSPLGIPCQKPPFGTMTAIDMKTQKVKWQVPLGTVQDTVLYGIKMGLPMPIGMPTIGGSLSTQGGLVFFAATQDYYLRAFDGATGKEVWKARLPVGSQGSPISYVSPETGKQYILISAGGARQSPDRGDYVIAYALPD